jgi:hypothetical protein
MQTKKIVGENLKIKLLIGMTSRASNPALSAAIDVQCIDQEEITNAKLVLHSRKELIFNSQRKILSFTGTIITEKKSRPCVGYYLTDELVEECQIMVI